MTTLESIHRAAELPVKTYADTFTPADHFVATAKVLGIVCEYLLVGAKDDPQARIVGRIEWPASSRTANAYAGGGLKGGTWLHSDLPEAFDRMVAAAKTGIVQ